VCAGIRLMTSLSFVEYEEIAIMMPKAFADPLER
jgi:hypothetical protein